MAIFEFETDYLEVKGSWTRQNFKIEVSLDEDEILSKIKIEDAISAYGEDDLLDLIGEDKVKEYFNLKDADDE